MGRDPDRSWRHRHTSVKLFWSQPRATWISAAAEARPRTFHLAFVIAFITKVDINKLDAVQSQMYIVLFNFECNYSNVTQGIDVNYEAFTTIVIRIFAV